jgi:hypothetical protein
MKVVPDLPKWVVGSSRVGPVSASATSIIGTQHILPPLSLHLSMLFHHKLLPFFSATITNWFWQQVAHKNNAKSTSTISTVCKNIKIKKQNIMAFETSSQFGITTDENTMPSVTYYFDRKWYSKWANIFCKVHWVMFIVADFQESASDRVLQLTSKNQLVTVSFSWLPRISKWPCPSADFQESASDRVLQLTSKNQLITVSFSCQAPSLPSSKRTFWWNWSRDFL